MTYDPSKIYTVTDRSALSVWQPNNDIFSLIQNVNDNSVEIRNNMSDDQALSAIKYNMEDNPTAEVWYSQPSGSLENTIEIAAYGRCPMFAADGSVADYYTLYRGSKNIVAWHDGSNWHPNTKSSKFDMLSVNGAYMRNLTTALCHCSVVLTTVIGSNHQGLTGFVSTPARDYTNSSRGWQQLWTVTGESIPYDTTKKYTLLGTYLQDGTTVTDALETGIVNSGNKLTVMQKANTTLCYVKYKIEDKPVYTIRGYFSKYKDNVYFSTTATNVLYDEDGKEKWASPNITYTYKGVYDSDGQKVSDSATDKILIVSQYPSIASIKHYSDYVAAYVEFTYTA